MSGPAALEIADLSVTFPGGLEAVRGVSLSVARGEALAVVGESGSGKSLTMLAAMGLQPRGALVAGSAKLKGEELIGARQARLRALRGDRIAMIFQDPLSALNPVLTVGEQIAEAIRLHRPQMGKREIAEKVLHLLDLVAAPDPRRRAAQHPHEFSGGMRQRAMIAMAIANDPDILIADEPTTALDVTVQAQVLGVLARLRERLGLGLVLVTHDLGVVAGVADRVAVMYAGRVAEAAAAGPIFADPRHPYTRGLLGSVPRIAGGPGRLASIRGAPPRLGARAAGCAFAPRCDMAAARCGEEPPLLPAGAAEAACWFADAPATEAAGRGQAAPRLAPRVGAPVLSVREIVKDYPLGRSLLPWRAGATLRAVGGVSFDLMPGETLGLVGESGCGKSTLGRVTLGLIRPSSGSVSFRGREIAGLARAEMRPLRRHLQMVFQDPYGSLHPRMRVGEIVAEPLRLIGERGAKAAAKAEACLEKVGLEGGFARRWPHELSGGQRQRVGIARALALEPEALVLDEPVSALDVSIQAGVLNLLADLQAELGLAYLFIAHDLAVVRHISRRVAVMYRGRIVELAEAEALYAAPLHPYTGALLAAAPIPDPAAERARRRAALKAPAEMGAEAAAGGCPFRPLCPRAKAKCAEPPPLAAQGEGRLAACWFPG